MSDRLLGFNTNLSGISLSEIRRLFELAQKKENLISFGIGEPDFDTPEVIKRAAKEALDEGYTHYTPNMGFLSLRDALAGKLRERNGLPVTANNVLVTVGGAQAIFLALMTILNPGDEVIILEPAFGPYAAVTRMVGARPVACRLLPECEFHVEPSGLERCVTRATRAIVVNSPHNPTGVVFTAEDLGCIAACARRNDLWVVSDEVYERIIYDGRQHVSIASMPGMFERTITINGFSKTYAMTGWRVGYLAARVEFVESALKVLQNSVACAPAVCQMAALAALRRADPDVESMRSEYAKRRELLYDGLRSVPGLRPFKPEGTFYMFVDVSGTGRSDKALAELLLEKESVVVVPGSGFGGGLDRYIRFSFALGTARIPEGVSRIRRVVSALPGLVTCAAAPAAAGMTEGGATS